MGWGPPETGHEDSKNLFFAGVSVSIILDSRPIFQIAPLPTDPPRHFRVIMIFTTKIKIFIQLIIFTCGFICV